MTKLNLDSVVVRNEGLMSADVGQAVVILHMDQSSYFDTEGVGADLWRLLESPVRIRALLEEMQTRYSVAADDCARDVLAFLENALNEGLIKTEEAGD